ncbi:hypothetical protein PIB30_014782 [Stylosanthes scabra]|uniref:Uncharacterized protein n=1 Tax=Stylosanthes scabra TaxID=79078 RepID=A0ABU6Z3F8_9FABA|nr:hypothetical protein [Stylosanthes scabra]
MLCGGVEIPPVCLLWSLFVFAPFMMWGIRLPPGPPIDEDEVWDRMAGGRKKGRIYNKGKVPKRPTPWLVDPEDASTCSGPDAREHITLLNLEIHQQAEQHMREMEYWKQRYETDVTRLQTTIDTQ